MINWVRIKIPTYTYEGGCNPYFDPDEIAECWIQTRFYPLLIQNHYSYLVRKRLPSVRGTWHCFVTCCYLEGLSTAASHLMPLMWFEVEYLYWQALNVSSPKKQGTSCTQDPSMWEQAHHVCVCGGVGHCILKGRQCWYCVVTVGSVVGIMLCELLRYVGSLGSPLRISWAVSIFCAHWSVFKCERRTSGSACIAAKHSLQI